MKINIIDIKDKNSWKKIFINKSGLPSQSHDYAKFCLLNSSEKVYLLDINIPKFKTFCPVNINQFNGFKIMKSLPGYSGFNIDLDNSILTQINKYFYKNKILSFYFNSSPYVQDKLVEKIKFSSFKNNCYILKLDNSSIKLKEKINRNIKKNIIKTEALKIDIKEVSKLDFEIFKKLYIKTCNRLNLNPNSFYKKSALDFLINNYQNKLILTAEYKKKIISVSIFIYEGDYSDYLLNFSDDDYNFSTSSLIMNSAELLKEKSVKYLNLGGGISNDDGLEKFKKSFNGDQTKIFSIKMISDNEIYSKFSENLNNNYFPPFMK